MKLGGQKWLSLTIPHYVEVLLSLCTLIVYSTIYFRVGLLENLPVQSIIYLIQYDITDY
jgi:hypothetical protein